MISRLYVEKKEGYRVHERNLLSDIRSFLHIECVESLRLFQRYDIEGISSEMLEKSMHTVFSEPQVDNVFFELPYDADAKVFAVEYLPGQFDQRADSASQCVQLLCQGERVTVKTARVYILYGKIDDTSLNAIKKYLINPVECRETTLDKPETLDMRCNIPTSVDTIKGFISMSDSQLDELVKKLGLAMDGADIRFCRDYFVSVKRDPTISEIKVIDTYWSDHCRHTTFSTSIDNVEFDNETVRKAYDRYLKLRKELNVTKPVTLMNIATIGAKALKKSGELDSLDVSEEINACTVNMDVDVDGRTEKWLLLFKNETHNHPTEIEPFGGAATCIGGAIRDPLSGRAYVYQAMRITGASDPTVDASKTRHGKLPQRKLVITAANGNSSYGNQIGIATGLVDEIYHSGYEAKHMEIGAVIGAVPKQNVRRETPAPGDKVILIGGRTGRDGCGGATGSSKSHNTNSLENCGAEVQKGNAPEERKLQRLFRNSEAAKMIKRCNDFGAGGVSVAIGELADGMKIDLNAVLKKYEGLDGTELAISESQERMAVVVSDDDVKRFKELAAAENLEATVVAEITKEPRLSAWWNGAEIIGLSREFLASNGAQKHTSVAVPGYELHELKCEGNTLEEKLVSLMSNINVASKRGLLERFDSTIGAASVLMPLGGKYQSSPAQAMAAKIPVLGGETKTCSIMAYGFNPYISERDPYSAAYLAVIESVSKVIARGGDISQCYLTLQEYFEKLKNDPKRWAKPFSALLGALDAQMGLRLAAIGGKDSMSGTFEDIDVPPTLVSFAVSVSDINRITSPEFKRAGSRVVWIGVDYNEDGLPDCTSQRAVFELVSNMIKRGDALSVYTPGFGGAAEALVKMCMGNRIGIELSDDIYDEDIFSYAYGSFIIELAEKAQEVGILIGHTVPEYEMRRASDRISLEMLEKAYNLALYDVYPANTSEKKEQRDVPDVRFSTNFRAKPAISVAKPKALIPAFPGTNCEYDTERALRLAGADTEIFIVRNIRPALIEESILEFAERVKRSNILFIPGGFSGGDEPDGSGKFITAFLRNPRISDAIHEMLNVHDGLICGVCNGFQALIKLGLVPYGEIRDMDTSCPTLTYNSIGRHQSRIVNVKVASNKSPWLMYCNTGDIFNIPISHGEGRFVCGDSLFEQLAKNGQIATQYCDMQGKPTMNIDFNPNGSMYAVEGITSPDGRVFGRMGHAERYGNMLYKNVPTSDNSGMFRGAVDYFRI